MVAALDGERKSAVTAGGNIDGIAVYAGVEGQPWPDVAVGFTDNTRNQAVIVRVLAGGIIRPGRAGWQHSQQ